MPQIQICPKGHRWDPTRDPRPIVEDRYSSCPQCGAAPEAFSLHDTLRPDDSEVGPIAPPPELPGYEILAEIARGGMGVIYRARHLATNRIVALKLISAGAHASPADVARFRAEVQAVSRLHHPQVVEVFEVGEHAGLPFFALEFMDRGSLAHSLAGSPLPPRYAAELLELLARAIQAAHESGILHRDIKPGNVLLATPSDQTNIPDVARLIGLPKLTDFGLAKRIGEAPVITRTGAVLGTPAYMAPELAEGFSGQATTAVDVYSLGAVLYETLTGKPPYGGTNALHTLDQVRRVDPVPPDRIVPGLPPDLVTVCLRAMAREPRDRYPSAGAMADDLRRFLDEQPVTATREPLWRSGVRLIRRQPVIAALSLAIAVVGALCVFLAIMAFRLSFSGTTPPNTNSDEYYGGVVRRRGVAEGIYRLTAEQVKRREVSYRIHRRDQRVEKVEAVDRHGRPTTRHGFVAYLERGDGDQPFRRECRWEYQYDDTQVVKETAYDRTGQVVWAFRYTAGNTGHYTDKRGFPRPRAGSGAAYVSFVYSDDGLVKEFRYLNASGRSRPDRNGIFGQRHDHDSRGFVIGISFLGAEDQPVLHPDGYAREVRRYDDRGNRVETAYVGLDALPVHGPSGVARKTTTYDADGNPTEVRAFGLDGALTRRWEGYAIENRAYDTSGRLTSLSFQGTEGAPARDRFGVARYQFTYHDGGRRREESYFDRENKPVKHRVLSCTRLTRVFDDDDDHQETEIIAHDFDPANRRELRFGLPAPHVKRQYDDRGNVVDETYFDREGRPSTSWFGVHRVKIAFTERGERADMRFEDAEGKPVEPRVAPAMEGATGRGPAQILWRWDDQGNNAEVRALTLSGEPDDAWTLPLIGLGLREGELPLPAGVARVAGQYDERGNVTEVSHFGRSGLLAPTKGTRGAITRGRLVLGYDEHGNMNEAALYGPDAKLATGIGVSRITATHDEDGRPLEYSLFGPEGRTAGANNISRYRFTYDRQGNRTSEAYFDTQDRPIAGPSGYAEARLLYDLGGNLTEAKFVDVEGNPMTTRVVVERATGMGDEPAVDLKVGDVLTRYAGQVVANTLQLQEVKRREDPGRSPREAEVLREGKMVTVKLPTGFPENEGGDARRRWGRPPGGSPFSLLRSLPTPGVTPPLTLGQVRLRTEVTR